MCCDRVNQKEILKMRCNLVNIREVDNNIVLEGIDKFEIEQILECGQCFRFERIDRNKYTIISRGKHLYVEQTGSDVTFFNTTINDYEYIWKEYFDIERDYSRIINEILESDNTIIDSVEAKSGIRIVKQEPFETLISFIISQNKQIPHIKKIVETLSVKYGDFIYEYNNKKIYAFPTIEQLAAVTEEELRDCKVGFRAPYIKDACNKLVDGTINFIELYKLSTREAREKLMQIKGVGEKIADCVLLFALGKTDVFPTDVWIKRVVESKYFNGKECSKKEILEFAANKFGDLSGYAQQYLFYYGREQKVGKNVK
jgi:N-glycosylase/DNA lyase